MRFKIVLWVLGFLMERASKKNPRFQKKLEGMDLTLEVSSEDGTAFHYIVKDQRVLSYPGRASAPTFLSRVHEPTMAIKFKNSKTGFKIFTSKDKKFAMMSGIQNKNISIEGNPLYLGWFQGLANLI